MTFGILGMAKRPSSGTNAIKISGGLTVQGTLLACILMCY